MPQDNSKFTSQRNRFAEQSERQGDKTYMKYRKKMYRKDHSPNIKGLGFYIFLLTVYLLAYIVFAKVVFDG